MPDFNDPDFVSTFTDPFGEKTFSRFDKGGGWMSTTTNKTGEAAREQAGAMAAEASVESDYRKAPWLANPDQLDTLNQRGDIGARAMEAQRKASAVPAATLTIPGLNVDENGTPQPVSYDIAIKHLEEQQKLKDAAALKTATETPNPVASAIAKREKFNNELSALRATQEAERKKQIPAFGATPSVMLQYVTSNHMGATQSQLASVKKIMASDPSATSEDYNTFLQMTAKKPGLTTSSTVTMGKIRLKVRTVVEENIRLGMLNLQKAVNAGGIKTTGDFERAYNAAFTNPLAAGIAREKAMALMPQSVVNNAKEYDLNRAVYNQWRKDQGLETAPLQQPEVNDAEGEKYDEFIAANVPGTARIVESGREGVRVEITKESEATAKARAAAATEAALNAKYGGGSGIPEWSSSIPAPEKDYLKKTGAKDSWFGMDDKIQQAKNVSSVVSGLPSGSILASTTGDYLSTITKEAQRYVDSHPDAELLPAIQAGIKRAEEKGEVRDLVSNEGYAKLFNESMDALQESYQKQRAQVENTIRAKNGSIIRNTLRNVVTFNEAGEPQVNPSFIKTNMDGTEASDFVGVVQDLSWKDLNAVPLYDDRNGNINLADVPEAAKNYVQARLLQNIDEKSVTGQYIIRGLNNPNMASESPELFAMVSTVENNLNKGLAHKKAQFDAIDEARNLKKAAFSAERKELAKRNPAFNDDNLVGEKRTDGSTEWHKNLQTQQERASIATSLQPVFDRITEANGIKGFNSDTRYGRLAKDILQGDLQQAATNGHLNVNDVKAINDASQKAVDAILVPKAGAKSVVTAKSPWDKYATPMSSDLKQEGLSDIRNGGTGMDDGYRKLRLGLALEHEAYQSGQLQNAKVNYTVAGTTVRMMLQDAHIGGQTDSWDTDAGLQTILHAVSKDPSALRAVSDAAWGQLANERSGMESVLQEFSANPPSDPDVRAGLNGLQTTVNNIKKLERLHSTSVTEHWRRLIAPKDYIGFERTEGVGALAENISKTPQARTIGTTAAEIQRRIARGVDIIGEAINE